MSQSRLARLDIHLRSWKEECVMNVNLKKTLSARMADARCKHSR